MQFELTPKALANFSPGLERSDNPGFSRLKSDQTLKGFGDWRTLSGLTVSLLVFAPRVLATLEPWAKISKHLRCYFKLHHYRSNAMHCDEQYPLLTSKHSAIRKQQQKIFIGFRKVLKYSSES